MQIAIECPDQQRHDQSGDHRQCQPAKRNRDRKRAAAEDQGAAEAEDIGAEPRPRRANDAVFADQDI